jgi:hypothetical protein
MHVCMPGIPPDQAHFSTQRIGTCLWTVSLTVNLVCKTRDNDTISEPKLDFKRLANSAKGPTSGPIPICCFAEMPVEFSPALDSRYVHF